MRLSFGLLLAAAPLLALGFAAPEVKTAAPARPGASVLYPPDSAVVTTERVQVVVLAPASQLASGVTLDGKPLKMERAAFAETWMVRAIRRGSKPEDRPALLDNRADAVLWLALTPLAPGRHVLAANGTQTRLFRSARTDGSGGPAGWPVFRDHPPLAADATAASACFTCHAQERSAGILTLGQVKTPDACTHCHPDADLQLKHRHVMDFLSRCWSCHDPHGSTHAKLLVDDQQKLCSRCHELGHSKG